jgi:hypothetical protein
LMNIEEPSTILKYQIFLLPLSKDIRITRF